MAIERPIIFTAESVRAVLAGHKSVTRRVVGPGNSYVDGDRIPKAWWASRNFDFSRAWVDPGPSPAGNAGPYLKVPARHDGDDFVHRIYPLWAPGDQLWVRETWSLVGRVASTYLVAYRSDATGGGESLRLGEPMEVDIGFEGPSPKLDAIIHELPARWRSPIFMPRWASRLTLEVTEVRVERLQAITAGDAEAEGVRHAIPDEPNWPIIPPDGRAQSITARFRVGWDRINGRRPGCAWEDNPWTWVVSFRALELATEDER